MSKQGDLLEAVNAVIPYPQHVTDIDLSEEDTVRLTWRGDRFRISENIVEECQTCFLCGSNKAVLLEALVRIGLRQVHERKRVLASSV